MKISTCISSELTLPGTFKARVGGGESQRGQTDTYTRHWGREQGNQEGAKNRPQVNCTSEAKKLYIFKDNRGNKDRSLNSFKQRTWVGF